MATKPSIVLALDGKSTVIAPYIASIEYSECLDALDVLAVNISLPPTDTAADLIKAAKPGVPYKLTFYTIDGTEVRSVTGDIVRVTLRRSPKMPWTLQLVGLETLHRLRDVRVSEVSELAKDKIVSELVQKAGLTAKAESVSATEKEEVLFDDTALALLKRYADERNFVVWAADTTVYFTPREKVQSSKALELAWGTDVRALDLTMDLQGIATSVTVMGRDIEKSGEQGVKYKAAASDLPDVSGGDTGAALRKKAFGDFDLVLNEEDLESQQSSVEERAKGELFARAERFLQGTVTAIGQPDACLGKKVKITGTYWPFAGPFLIRKVDHFVTPGQGFTSRIAFFSDSLPTESS